MVLPLGVDDINALPPVKICESFKLKRKQRRMCKRDAGVAETLVEAMHMSARECQHQFHNERWNCTLGKTRLNMLKRGKSASQHNITQHNTQQRETFPPPVSRHLPMIYVCRLATMLARLAAVLMVR